MAFSRSLSQHLVLRWVDFIFYALLSLIVLIYNYCLLLLPILGRENTQHIYESEPKYWEKSEDWNEPLIPQQNVSKANSISSRSGCAVLFSVLCDGHHPDLLSTEWNHRSLTISHGRQKKQMESKSLEEGGRKRRRKKASFWGKLRIFLTTISLIWLMRISFLLMKVTVSTRSLKIAYTFKTLRVKEILSCT